MRIIAATNRNLKKLVSEGKFREDLYYRLNVINIHMPALRERKEDIPLLCKYFIKLFNREQNKNVQRLSPEAEKLLLLYDYPGNVRQLANIIEHAMILTNREVIGVESLPAEVHSKSQHAIVHIKDAELRELLAGMPIKEVERIIIETTLTQNGGRRELTARQLGISVRSLYNKIKEYKL